MGKESRAASGVPLKLKPVQDGCCIWFDITLGAVRPETFACDNVGEAVAVQIGESKSVWLGESDTVFGLFGAISHKRVFFKGDLALFRLLFEPGETPAMGIERSDNVVATITIDIVSKHLGAPFVPELKLVANPFSARSSGLFVPAFVQEKVETAIAIQVANPGAVIELLPSALVGDRME